MTADIVINVIAKDNEFLPVYSSELAAGADVRAFIGQD
jgi:dUTPase